MSEESKRQRFRKILKAAEADVSHVLELVRDFLTDYPQHPGARLQLGRTLVEMGRYEEARLVFKGLIPIAPKDKLPWVFAQLGHLYDAKGDHARAAQWFRKAIDRCSSDSSLHMYLGETLALSGDLDGALASFRQAIRCCGGYRDEAYLKLGYVLRAKEEYLEARRCFKKALDIDPNYRKARKALKDVERALDVKRSRT